MFYTNTPQRIYSKIVTNENIFKPETNYAHMNKFQEHQNIKEAIVHYVKEHSGESQTENPSSMISELSQQFGRQITIKDLKQCMYYGSTEKRFPREKHQLHDIYFEAKTDLESIARIEKLLDKTISEMSKEEMEQHAVALFGMPLNEYNVLAANKGITPEMGENNLSFEYLADGLTLIGALQNLHDVTLDKKEFMPKVMNRDFNLGYFENFLKLRMKEDMNNPYMTETLEITRHTLNQSYDEMRRKVDGHKKFDEELTAKHTMLKPRLLGDKTLNLGTLRPLAIAFHLDNGLMVLGQRYFGDDKNAESELTLEKYDIHNGNILKSKKTNISASFEGTIMGTSGFSGNISVGSNGIIYVGCNNKIQRFTPELELLKLNENGFQDALSVVNKYLNGGDSELRWISHGAFQAVENDGVHYFVLRPNFSPYCYNNILIATDGKQIIGAPTAFSPTRGFGCTAFDHNARIVVQGNNLYLKANHDILIVDRSLTKEAYDKAFKIIEGNTLIQDCIPSNHCVDKENRVWANTQLEDEVVSSIKAYIKGNEHGEIATHFYPENHPGGWPAFRSMAINLDGILAYTDTFEGRIHLYDTKGK